MVSSLRVAYVPEQRVEHFLGGAGVLAFLRFNQAANTIGPDASEIQLSLRQLGGEQRVEVWPSATPVEVLRHGDVICRSNGEFLFGAIHFNETSHTSLKLLSHRAYEQIFDLLDQLGGHRLVRVWNYFPRINHPDRLTERYQLFCVGRYEAFEASGQALAAVPAATAIGTQGEGLIVYFLASLEAGVPVENPRQVSAYHYPRLYSPKPPMFSRAVWHGGDRNGQLFVSGTASVAGHETLYGGDTLRQLDEVMRNLQSLLDRAGREGARNPKDFDLLKVYLRRADDYAMVKQRITSQIGDVPCVFLQADICRSGLMVEIDALYGSGAS